MKVRYDIGHWVNQSMAVHESSSLCFIPGKRAIGKLMTLRVEPIIAQVQTRL